MPDPVKNEDHFSFFIGKILKVCESGQLENQSIVKAVEIVLAQRNMAACESTEKLPKSEINSSFIFNELPFTGEYGTDEGDSDYGSRHNFFPVEMVSDLPPLPSSLLDNVDSLGYECDPYKEFLEKDFSSNNFS